MILEWFIKNRPKVIIAGVMFIALTVLISATSDNVISKFILEYFQHWLIIFGTMAAIVLAYIAFMSVLENRRIRNEDKDFSIKMKVLDDIHNWVKEAFRAHAFYYTATDEVRWQAEVDMDNLAVRGISLIDMGQIFDGEFSKEIARAGQAVQSFRTAMLINSFPTKTDLKWIPKDPVWTPKDSEWITPSKRHDWKVEAKNKITEEFINSLLMLYSSIDSHRLEILAKTIPMKKPKSK